MAGQVRFLCFSVVFFGKNEFQSIIIESVDSISRDGPDCPYM